MKWIVGILVTSVLVLGGVVALTYVTALRSSRPIGFQIVQVQLPARAPLPVAIWYPTTGNPLPTTPLGLSLMDVSRDGPVDGQGLPLVVISHGNGGGPGSHADTAMALADAGFVVAAPLHEGDNYLDESAFGSERWLPNRSRDVRATLDYMLAHWSAHARIARNRIGVFGFSAGGLTALMSVGAEPDLSRIATHCAEATEFVCTLLSRARSEWLAGNTLPSASIARDERLRAAVVAAPGLGFTLTAESLSQISTPVQLWSGEADTNVPYASNVAPIREALGDQAEYHTVPSAGHFAFLAPCGPIGPPLLCRDGGGFDRKAFHRTFNAQVVTFFEANLAPLPALSR